MTLPRTYFPFLVVCLSLQMVALVNVSQAVGIPPAPALNGIGFFVQDYAAVFINEEQDFERIGNLQEEAFVDHSTPIIIVTIETMKPFGYHPDDFEKLATAWFNRWKIGTETVNGKNQGIMILLVKKERRCRIELGADWGLAFDTHCQKIMNRKMVPYFKRGDYATGLRKGTEQLLAMVQTGPHNSPSSATMAFNPAIIFFGLIGCAILVMLMIVAWRERENAAGIALSLATFVLIIGCVVVPYVCLPILGLVLLGSFVYKSYRVAKGLDPRPQRPSLRDRWQQFKTNITSWAYWREAILNFFRNLGKSDGYAIGDSYSGGWGGGGGGSWGGGGGFSGGGFSGGSSGGGGASGSW